MRSAAGRIVGRPLLGWALVAGATALLFAMAQRAAEAQDAFVGDAQGAERGSLLYAQYCAECHGAGGRGGPMPQYEGVAPALLPELNSDVTVAYVDLVLSTGRMPPAGSPFNNQDREIVFDDPAERADIIAWMRQEFGITGEVAVPEPAGPGLGQDAWNTNCAHCHGATGAGGVAGGGAWTPPVSNKTPEQIAQAIRVGPFQMPRFGEEQVSDEEVAAIVAFMQEVHDEEGTPVLGLVELNPVYASAWVALLALAMLWSLIWIGGRPAWFPDQPKDDERQPDVPAGARRRTHDATAPPPHDPDEQR